MAAADLARHGLTGPPTVLEGRLVFLHAFPAVLRVSTRTGEELEARVEVNRGGPGNPLSDEELARKFHDAVRSLPEERAAELAARTSGMYGRVISWPASASTSSSKSSRRSRPTHHVANAQP